MARRPKTDYVVAPVVHLGPRGGERHVWIIQRGPENYYREIAGPFTSRKQALKALAELVNAAA